MSLMVMVGTDHADVRGPARLSNLLEYTRPATIGIESSEWNLERIAEGLGERMRRANEHASIQGIIDALYAKAKSGEASPQEFEDLMKLTAVAAFEYTIGYECFIPIMYMHTVDPTTRIVPLLSHQVHERAGAVWDDGFATKKDTGQITDETFSVVMGTMYRDHRTMYSAAGSDEGSKQRKDIVRAFDDDMEPRIRQAVRLYPERNTLIICGYNHLFDSYQDGAKNLYERVHDLNPVRFGLDAVDGFGGGSHGA